MTATQLFIAVLCIIVAIKSLKYLVRYLVGFGGLIYLCFTEKIYEDEDFKEVLLKAIIFIALACATLYGCCWIFSTYVMVL